MEIELQKRSFALVCDLMEEKGFSGVFQHKQETFNGNIVTMMWVNLVTGKSLLTITGKRGDTTVYELKEFAL